MNFRALLYTLAAITLLSISVRAEVHVGAMVGGLNSGLSGNTPPNTEMRSRKAAGFGAILDIGLTKDVRLSVQPMYLPRGGILATVDSETKEVTDSVAIDLDYLSIPIFGRVIADNGIAYVIGGIEFGFLMSAEWKPVGEPAVDIGDLMRDVDIAADLGVGVLPRLGSVRGMVELRYSQSLRNATEEDVAGSFVPRVKYSGFQLWFGVLVPLSGGGE